MALVEYAQHGHVAIVTFNRPEARNAINPEVAVRLAEAWQDVKDNDAVRVAVLTGTGSAFCAGADLGQLIPMISGARKPENEWDERVASDRGIIGRAILRDFDTEKPVIAAINGHAIAGGMEIVQGTDIRMSVPQAKFGVQEVKWAIFPRRRIDGAPTGTTAVCQGHGTPADRRSHYRGGSASARIPQLRHR